MNNILDFAKPKQPLTEEQVLKRLNIKDFRHLSKDKVMKFASMLPYIDPEVAKKALDQFPEYAKSVTEMVKSYQGVIEKSFEKNENSQNAYYNACNQIIEELKRQLADTDITFEEQQTINNEMIQIAQMMSEKDTENKQHLIQMAQKFGVVVLGFAVVIASVLGSNIQINQGDNSGNSSDY